MKMSITLTRNYSGKTTELIFNGLTSDVKVGILYSDTGNNLRIGLKKTLANLKNAHFVNFESYLDNFLDDLITETEVVTNTTTNNTQTIDGGYVGLIVAVKNKVDYTYTGKYSNAQGTGFFDLYSQKTSVNTNANDQYLTNELTACVDMTLDGILQSDNGYIFGCNIGRKQINSTLTIQSQTETINIVNNLTDCTSDTESVTVDNTEKTITLTANTGYQFETTPTISINGTNHNFTLSSGKTTGTYSFIPNSGDTIVVNAVATVIPTPTKKATVTSHLTNVTMSPMIDTFEEHSNVTLKLTCGENYSFQGVPYITENITEGTTETQQFIKVNDKEYTLTLPTGDFYSAVTINYKIDVYATAIYNTETVTKYGLIYLYKPTKDILEQLSLIRFVNIATDEYDDLGKYITTLKRIYLDVASISQNNIILGNKDTNISCPLIDNDDVIVNLGDVSLNGIYNNAIDNKYIDIQLILPFIGIEKLDGDKIANKTINIKYKCNLITGSAIAYIYLVENESLHLIETFTGNIGFDVPYILQGSQNELYQQEVNNENIFNVLPQVKIFENKKASINNSIYETDLILKIADIPSGYFAVEKIINSENESIILNEELSEIENILKGGIEI